MNKRGISAIVATVLIVLITVTAVTIIWAAIIPFLSGLGDTDLDTTVEIVTTGGYTAYDSDTGLAVVQVVRNAGDDKVENIRITFNFAGESYSSIVPAPSPNQMLTYAFNLDVGEFPAPDSVTVAPIYIRGSSEKEGRASRDAVIGVGKISKVSGEIYILGDDYRVADAPDCVDTVDCGSPNQCQNSVSCTAGECVYGNEPDTVSCDDNNVGTGPDFCNGGSVLECL